MANTKRFQVKHGLRTKDIEFTDNSGASNEIIASFIDATDTLSFSGNSGQLFAITDSITGSIFTVNDISGMPSIEVKDTGDIILAETAGNVGIATATPAAKLHIVGQNPSGLIVENGSGIAPTQPYVSMAANNYSSAFGTFRWEDQRAAQPSPSFIWEVHDGSGTVLAYDFRTGATGAAGSKLAITQDGNVGIGTNTPAAKTVIATTADNDGLNIESYNTTQSEGPALRLAKSLNSTVGTQTAVTVSDTLGQIIFAGSDGSAFYDGAAIKGVAAQSFTGTNGGTELSFHTTDNNTQVIERKMILSSSGVLTLGTGHSSTSPGTAVFTAPYGSGTDVPGGDMQIFGGRSTGDAAGGEIQFWTGSAGVAGTGINAAQQRVTITADGNVGIGIDAPTVKLDVDGIIKTYDGRVQGIVYPYNEQISLPVSTAGAWYKIWSNSASPDGAPKLLKFFIVAGGDNTSWRGEFLVDIAGYNFQHSIELLDYQYYNPTKLEAIKTVNPGGTTGLEVWIQLGDVTTSIGTLSVSCDDNQIQTLTATTEPSDTIGTSKLTKTSWPSDPTRTSKALSHGLMIARTNDIQYNQTLPIGDLILSRRNTGNNTDQTVGIRFEVTGWEGQTTGAAAIEAIQDGGNSSSADLAFITRNAGTYSEKVRIQDDGNVGIGTSNPAVLLHTLRTSTTAYDAASTNNDITALFQNDGAAGHSTIQLQTTSSGTANTGQATISAFNKATSSKDTILSFGVRRESDDAVYEAMRIDGETGNVGIGTASPSAALSIFRETNTTNSATGTTLLNLTNDVGADINQQKTFVDFIFLDDNGNEYPQVRIGAEVGPNANADSNEREGEGAFVVYTNNATGSGPAPTGLTEKMRVDYQGNVGIGTTNPDVRLRVSSDDQLIARLGSTLTDASIIGVRIQGIDPSASNDTVFVDWFYDPENRKYGFGEGTTSGDLPINSGLSHADIVFDSGNVGIGTSSPSNTLEVASDADNSGITIYNDFTSGGRNARISFKSLNSYDASSVLAAITATPTSSANTSTSLVFQTSGDNSLASAGLTERMRITSAGNVGIGTTSPTNKFEVAGTQGQLFSVADSFTGTIFSVNDGSGVPSVEVMDTGDIYLAEFGGKVGIGTSAPARPLEISFASETFGLRLTRNDAVGNSLLEFANTSGVQNYIGHDAGLNAFVINNDGANKVVVTDSGNVGIGTNTPTYLFTVDDLGAADGTQNEIARFSNTTAGATSNYIYIGASSGPDWKIGKNVPGTSSRSNFDIADNADAVRLTIQSSGEVISPAAGLYGNMGTAWHTENAMRGGNFSADIANDTTVLKLFNASPNDESSNQRAVGDYSTGIGFMHLDPDASTWGTSFVGAHAWIGLKVSSTSAQELSDLIFATNASTTSGSYPTQAAKLSGGGVLTLDKASTYALHIISSGSTGNTQGSIVLQSSTVDSPESRGQGVYMFNEGTDRTWYMGTQYNSAGSFHISTLAGTALDESTAQNTNYALRIDSNKSATFASTLTAGDITISETTPQLNINDTNATNATDQLGYISFQRIGVESAWIGYGSVLTPEFVIRNTEGSLVIRNSNGEVELRSPDNNNTISMIMDNTDTLSFEGDAGQLFSLSDSFTGTIFSVNDGSGIPSIEVIDTGDVYIAEFGGSVGVGNSAPAYKLDVTGDIRATGDVLSTSDERLKDDIQPIENALDKITAMNGVSFKYKGTDKASVGLIAQNVEQVVPEVVQEDNAGYKAVSYGNLVGVLIEAIKEQQSTINSLVSRIEKLEKGE